MQPLIDLLDSLALLGQAGASLTLYADQFPADVAETFTRWASIHGYCVEDKTTVSQSHSSRSMRIRGEYNRGSIALIWPAVPVIDVEDRPAFPDEITATYDYLPMSQSGLQRVTRDLRKVETA